MHKKLGVSDTWDWWECSESEGPDHTVQVSVGELFMRALDRHELYSETHIWCMFVFIYVSHASFKTWRHRGWACLLYMLVTVCGRVYFSSFSFFLSLSGFSISSAHNIHSSLPCFPSILLVLSLLPPFLFSASSYFIFSSSYIPPSHPFHLSPLSLSPAVNCHSACVSGKLNVSVHYTECQAATWRGDKPITARRETSVCPPVPSSARLSL